MYTSLALSKKQNRPLATGDFDVQSSAQLRAAAAAAAQVVPVPRHTTHLSSTRSYTSIGSLSLYLSLLLRLLQLLVVVVVVVVPLRRRRSGDETRSEKATPRPRQRRRRARLRRRRHPRARRRRQWRRRARALLRPRSRRLRAKSLETHHSPFVSRALVFSFFIHSKRAVSVSSPTFLARAYHTRRQPRRVYSPKCPR